MRRAGARGSGATGRLVCGALAWGAVACGALACGAVATCSNTGCIPDDVTRASGGRVLREGHLGTVDGVVAAAGTVRVLDGALDQGSPACNGGSGEARVCVRGGLTAAGRSGE